MEYRVASRAVMAHDFREGVRATLIDKDGVPRWKPASLAAVKDAEIEGYFAPLGTRELDM
jgi:enoyl-CoA hydratase